MSRQRAWEDERGFNLVEMLAVILIMGVVFAIATSTWFDWSEGRRVDSATNQLAADLRMAHSKATNRLTPQTVTLTSGSSDYTMTGVADLLDLDDCNVADVAASRCNDEHVVVVKTDASVEFKADGSAVVTGDNPDPNRFTVESSKDDTKNHVIEINSATSRIQIDPPTP